MKAEEQDFIHGFSCAAADRPIEFSAQEGWKDTQSKADPASAVAFELTDEPRNREEALVLSRKRLLLELTPEALRDLSTTLNDVGDVRQAQGDLAGAASAFDEALSLNRQLRQSLGNSPQTLRDLSIALDSVGDVRQAQGDLAGAASVFDESLSLSRQLRQSLGNSPQTLRDLSVSLNRLGEVRQVQVDLVGAAAAFEESLSLRRQLR